MPGREGPVSPGELGFGRRALVVGASLLVVAGVALVVRGALAGDATATVAGSGTATVGAVVTMLASRWDGK